MFRPKVWLSMGAAILGIAFTLTLVGSASYVEAQSPPIPPARFAGTLTIDGEPAPEGTVLQAHMGSALCSTATVSTEGIFVINVPADPPGCGADGGTVTFYVSGRAAQQTASWKNYDLTTLDLTVITTTFSLSPRWNLVTWPGTVEVPIATAVSSISSELTAIYTWDAEAERWFAYFPAASGIPGANDLDALKVGAAYWVAIKGPGSVTWSVGTAGE